MAIKHIKDDKNHVSIFSETERSHFAETSAPLVHGWTTFGGFSADSLDEAIDNARRDIKEAQEQKEELGDIADYIAALEARIELCEAAKAGKLTVENFKL